MLEMSISVIVHACVDCHHPNCRPLPRVVLDELLDASVE